MNKKLKIPFKELIGEKPLCGNYRVSFEIEINEDDDLHVDDLAQTIATGFEGQSTLNKIAHLDFEKIEYNPDIKVGDRVILTKAIQIEASVVDHEHYYTIEKEPTENMLGTMTIELPKGSQAIVNKIGEDKIELIDFDNTVTVPIQNIETEEIEDSIVNVDFAAVDKNAVEKMEE